VSFKSSIHSFVEHGQTVKKLLIKRNSSSASASDFAYSYSFLRNVVCRMSVVCHTDAPC